MGEMYEEPFSYIYAKGEEMLATELRNSSYARRASLIVELGKNRARSSNRTVNHKLNAGNETTGHRARYIVLNRIARSHK